MKGINVDTSDITLHTKNMGLKNLSKVCHIDKFWVVISMVPKTTSLRLSRRVSVAKLVKRSSSRTKQYIAVSNYFYFFPPKKRQKGKIMQDGSYLSRY